MSKRVRISNERVNSHGFRVLTSGMDVSQYSRNPVLLYMHERGQVIGYMKDVEVKDGEVTGEPVFDEATELSKRCKKQFEFGSLKMVSAGLEIYETSDDAALLAKEQKRPTVTRCKLYEVSLVDVGSNDDAIVLKMDGRTVNLAAGEACPLPLIATSYKLQATSDADSATSYELQATSDADPATSYELQATSDINPKQNEKQMELKEVAQLLGLQETATEAEVRDRIQLMKGEHERLESAEKQLSELNKARVESLVERGIGEKRIDASKREEFVALFTEIGAEKAEKLLCSMAQQVKPSQLIQSGQTAAGAPTADGWKSLHDVPCEQLMKLKQEQPEEYARLYKAEYGMEL